MAALTGGARMRSERGAELVEFALVLPVLVLVLLGMIDFGFLFQRYEVITNAAREGARIAVLPGYAAADVQARVYAYLQNGGVPNYSSATVSLTNVSIAVPSGTIAGKKVTVSYTESYLFLGPFAAWFGGSFSSVPLTATAVMRPESGS